ncbi:MAG TPA: hypothetical protein VFV03_07370 [Solirubrobacteraceae bacterium]|nr:hypothetical protein [Solirubrobacteraceae bacterium]
MAFAPSFSFILLGRAADRGDRRELAIRRARGHRHRTACPAAGHHPDAPGRRRHWGTAALLEAPLQS